MAFFKILFLGLSTVAKHKDRYLDIEAVPLTVGRHELLQRGCGLDLELGCVPTSILHLEYSFTDLSGETQVQNASKDAVRSHKSHIGEHWISIILYWQFHLPVDL